jgi:hypothetical protein
MNSPKYIIAYPYPDPETPFEELEPDDITFYLHGSNKTGKANGRSLLEGQSTCAADCSGCYFQTLDPYEIPADIAKKVRDDLAGIGYDIGLVYSDSFSDTALSQGESGSAFRYDPLGANNTMAWTSGNLLAGSKSGARRLTEGWKLGYGIITISLYNMVTQHPMSRTPSNGAISKAIQNIKIWNANNFPGNQNAGYELATTQLIHRENCNLDDMRRVAEWCLNNGVSVCRFNSFANFMDQSNMEPYEMTPEDSERLWRNLAILQEEYLSTPMKFAVSEDISARGIEACIPYFNPNDGWEKFNSERPYWCRAGYRLFSINGETQADGSTRLPIKACVDNWSKLEIGEVRQSSDDGRFKPYFNIPMIEDLRISVLDGKISTCWGGVGDPRGSDPKEAALFEELNARYKSLKSLAI